MKMNGFVIEDGVLLSYTGEDTEVVVPDEVVCIGEGAFSCHRTLTRAVIPDSVRQIDAAAFWSCSHLESVSIGNGVSVSLPEVFVVQLLSLV